MASTTVQGIVLLSAVVLAIAGDIVVGSTFAQNADIQTNQEQEIVIWTAVIPEGFPGHIYTWHLKSDGTYEEDGRDALSGRPIQRTLAGRWTVEGARMILRQDVIRFVFDGMIAGERYSGTLYLNGRRVSRFCAAKGEAVPQDDCEAGAFVSAARRSPTSQVLAFAGGAGRQP